MPPFLALHRRVVPLAIVACRGLVSATFAAIPRRFRYRFAVMTASLIPKSLRHTRSPRFEPRPAISSIRECVLGAILEAIDAAGLPYDPKYDVEGLDELIALSKKGPVFIVSSHANGMLSKLILPAWDDANVSVDIVALRDRFAVPGRATSLPTIRPEGDFMFRVRSRLRDGAIVSAMLDAYAPQEGFTHEARVGRGSIWMSDALLRLAVRCNARIVALFARLDGDRIHLIFHPIEASGDWTQLRDALVQRLREHVEETQAT